MPASFNGPDRVASGLRVGEIRAVRTFRLSRDGALLPVAHGSVPWSDGPNTARCERDDHTPAAPGCSCGFYAYGTLPAAFRHVQARRVVAVVACWGRVIPGTLGLRAQHARIEALWVSPRAKSGCVALVRRRYPSAALYRSRRKMIRQHQPTPLDSYLPRPRQGDRPAPSIPDRLSAGAENLAGCLAHLVIAAFASLVVIAVGLLILGLLVLLRHAI